MVIYARSKRNGISKVQVYETEMNRPENFRADTLRLNVAMKEELWNERGKKSFIYGWTPGS